jgi:hypothetical protein
MKLGWMFGSSMEAHHLLYAYLAVWLIQGGYALWIVWQWVCTKRTVPPSEPATMSHEDS